MMRCCAVLLTSIAALSGAARAQLPEEAARQWHAWRGPEATGVAPHGDPPLRWDAQTNIRWNTPVEGRGSASPIVWRDRIYLLTAVDTGRPGPDAAEGQRNLHQFKILCLDRRTGELLWERTANEAVPHESLHQTNTYASGSATTDGERLYASFGSFGVYCYDLDGQPLWQRDLGRMQTRNQFGEGVSPTVYGDYLIVNWDQESDSRIYALDAATGQTRWEQPRDEITSWNTPIVVAGGGRTQVVVNGTNRARGYDLHTGEVIWECGGQTVNAIASPVALEEVVFCMTGFRGNAVYAIPLSAVGDITGTDQVTWHFGRAGPYGPSPILYDDRLYFFKSNNAILTCL
ncbi:MAG TPA: PQQ-like beta-propeller repeat protein, partial [Lacipirellulaceae bacterium]|nr:PQQ-like beta-propeller repeat protein [Lacipirellulaceae bacterium]